MTAKICKLSTISSNGDWRVVFDDSDSSSDYWHSHSGSRMRMAELIGEFGDGVIMVDVQNGCDVKEGVIKAVFRLAEKTGYKAELVKEEKAGINNEKWMLTQIKMTKHD